MVSEKIFGNSIGAFVSYGKNGTTLVPLKVNADGELVVNLEAATVNIGDVDVLSSALPTGAATSAKQDTQITAEQAILAKIIAAPATEANQALIKAAVEAVTAKLSSDPATQTTLAHIKTAVEGATPAGSAIIGKVGIDQTTPGTTNKVDAGYTVVRSDTLFTGMAATSQYDAVGALVEIPNWARVAGGSATIREMRISVNNNAIAPQFEVHFFRNSDATVAADNVTWTELAAEYAKRAGYILMPACAKAGGSGTIDMVRSQHDDYGQSLSKEITCAAGATSIWVKLKLLNSGISFAATPGNQIVLSMVREQS
ncbi:MAG: hypothetical protein WC455_21265 [Dehalococcoidia bacterium]|jgi:hypothetical protein